MAELLYRVTVGADEASVRSPLTSNNFVVELICDQHSDSIGSDPAVAACDVTKKVIEHHFPAWPKPGYLIADKAEDVSGWQFAEWNTLSCGCRAAVTPNR